MHHVLLGVYWTRPSECECSILSSPLLLWCWPKWHSKNLTKSLWRHWPDSLLPLNLYLMGLLLFLVAFNRTNFFCEIFLQRWFHITFVGVLDTRVSSWHQLRQCSDGQHEDQGSQDQQRWRYRYESVWESYQQMERSNCRYNDHIPLNQWIVWQGDQVRGFLAMFILLFLSAATGI